MLGRYGSAQDRLEWIIRAPDEDLSEIGVVIRDEIKKLREKIGQIEGKK
jgi:hypothetical protein